MASANLAARLFGWATGEGDSFAGEERRSSGVETSLFAVSAVLDRLLSPADFREAIA